MFRGTMLADCLFLGAMYGKTNRGVCISSMRPTHNGGKPMEAQWQNVTMRIAKSCSLLSATPVLIALLLSGCADVSSNAYYPRSAETMRVSSPNGRFDAVLITDIYGPAAGGGVDSNVYIVLKGAPAPKGQRREILSADPFSHGNLVWKSNHQLEIHYDIAEIHEFTNSWGSYEVENAGSSGQDDFEIEIRLVPDSDWSAITPQGKFRSLGDDDNDPEATRSPSPH